MTMQNNFFKFYIVFYMTVGQVHAAPLDALLTANPLSHKAEVFVEASFDSMNETLDVLKIRAKDPQYAETNVGDYSGAHVRAGYGLTDDLSVHAGYWKRKIFYRQDQESIVSWQTAAQYRFHGDANSQENYAIRFGTWGNLAKVLDKTSPTNISRYTVGSMSIKDLLDFQVQIDAVGTWKLGEQVELSAFSGMGHSWVETGNIVANYTDQSGCDYKITFTQTGASGILVSPCLSPVVITGFTTDNTLVQSFSYGSNYYQVGGMLNWKVDNFIVRGGYQFQHLVRQNVDSLIAGGGGISYKNNHIFVMDVSYKLSPKTSVFARTQVMSNQFVGEIPFTYNHLTSSKFSKRYGYVSVGGRYTF